MSNSAFIGEKCSDGVILKVLRGYKKVRYDGVPLTTTGLERTLLEPA